MKVILDELTPKEFFTNGGVVKIILNTDELKSLFDKRKKFMFYEYKSYIRFLRELYLKYMTKYPELKTQSVYEEVNECISFYCNIGTKKYTIDPKFDCVKSLEFCNFYFCNETDDFEKTSHKDPFGITNCNFTVIDEDDCRWDEFAKQRLDRGFDNSELWNLDSTIAKFILPRLKAYAETICSCPAEYTSNKEWKDDLDRMVLSFDLYVNKNDLDWTDEDLENFKNGMNLFVKNFRGLWN